VFEFGVPDLTCLSELGTCPQDVLPGGKNSVNGNVYVNVFSGSYRAGGHVDWDFTFDGSAFSSVRKMTLEIVIVGMLGGGNIDTSGSKQIGNYLAIDGVPFFPITASTDSRDTHVIPIPTLSPGAHVFSVWAYDSPPGPLDEGWAGVDYAKLTVDGTAK
jgi:hypothetical protein